MRLVLADDDPHVRSAIRMVLSEEAAIQVVAECATGASLMDVVQQVAPDVALVDCELPGLRPRELATRCLVIAMSGRPEQRQAALRAGVSRFVCKGDAPDALLTALRELIGVAVE